MRWYNTSSSGLKKHNICVAYSSYPLLFILHFIYALIIAVFATAVTLQYFLLCYLVLYLLWALFKDVNLLTRLACLIHQNSQRLYPSLFQNHFQLSSGGEIISIDDESGKVDTVSTKQLHASSLIFWWGVQLYLEDKNNNRKTAWFIHKDSVSDRDYRRLTRTIKQTKLINY